MVKNFILILLLAIISTAFAVDPNDAYGQSCTIDRERSICGSRLVCINGTCTNCNLDSQCSSTGNIVCKNVGDTLISSSITNQKHC